MKIILLGAPGAGKGTQAEKLNEEFGLVHISTGDIFRRNMRQETPIGLKAKEYIDKGMLVPDEVTIELIEETLETAGDNYMLDGFPRTRRQAEALDGIVDIDAVINLDVDLTVLAERISGRRSCLECGYTTHISKMSGSACPKCGKEMIQRYDDNEETVKNRLNVYVAETAPLIEYYNRKGKLIDIDGMGSPEAVWERVKKVLKN